MSKHKSNVHPGQYKVAGRERQGEDVVHDRSKAKLTHSQAALEQHPYPEWPAPRQQSMPEEGTLEGARHAGVRLGKPGSGPKRVRRKATQESAAGRKPSATRARAAKQVLKRQVRRAASRASLARQARSSARRRTAAQRSNATRMASRTLARKR